MTEPMVTGLGLRYPFWKTPMRPSRGSRMTCSSHGRVIRTSWSLRTSFRYVVFTFVHYFAQIHTKHSELVLTARQLEGTLFSQDHDIFRLIEVRNNVFGHHYQTKASPGTKCHCYQGLFSLFRLEVSRQSRISSSRIGSSR